VAVASVLKDGREKRYLRLRSGRWRLVALSVVLVRWNVQHPDSIRLPRPPFCAWCFLALQIRVKAQQRFRRWMRRLEFDAWLRDCKAYRGWLMGINATFIGILAVR
jgi:hypothetical protein